MPALRSLGRCIFKAWMALAARVAAVVNAMLLAFVYYGMITPLGLVLRLTGRDPLRLRGKASETYWTSVDLPEDSAYYERLY